MNDRAMHLYDAAEELDKEARQNIAERLKAGETVSKVTLRDILECEFNTEVRFPIALADLEALLIADSKERAALCDRFLDGAIERFLNARDDLVQDEAERIEFERMQA